VKKVLHTIDEGLARAGEKFLLSKTVETYMNIALALISTALVILLGGWVFFQLRAMASMFM
jgi:hypothetical protein